MKALNPLVGAAIGAGGSTATAIAIRHAINPLKHPKLYKWSEAIGLGVGIGAGGAMFLLGKKKWRQTAYTTMAASVFSSGLRQAEVLLFPDDYKQLMAAKLMASNAITAAAAAAAADSGGMGIVDIEQATALKDAVVDPTTVLQGADLPQLVGANLASASQHVQLVGAPPLAQHAGSWGSTLFSR